MNGSSYRLNAVEAANGNGQAGTMEVRIGTLAAQAMPAANTQCRNAADRLCKASDNASALKTINDIFIGFPLSLPFR